MKHLFSAAIGLFIMIILFKTFQCFACNVANIISTCIVKECAHQENDCSKIQITKIVEVVYFV